MGAWVIDTLWGEVCARIARVDSFIRKKYARDDKLCAVPNEHYGLYRSESNVRDIGNDEDLGNVFESAATVAILRRDLRQVRRILVSLITKLPEATEEKFWRWEPGFGYRSNNVITGKTQEVIFTSLQASSPADYSVSDRERPGAKRTYPSDRARAATSAGDNRPRSVSRGRGRSSGPTSMPSASSAGFEAPARSRSARARRVKVSDIAEENPVPDFSEGIDYGEEEEEVHPEIQEPVKVVLNPRIGAVEPTMAIKLQSIQGTSVKPKMAPRPHYFERIKSWDSVGGISRNMMSTTKKWQDMISGIQDAGYGTVPTPCDYWLKPRRGHSTVSTRRREAIEEIISEETPIVFYDNIREALERTEDRGTHDSDDEAEDIDIVENERKLDAVSELVLPQEYERRITEIMRRVDPD
eukprot:3989494-Amphidinium_carterae.1